MDSEKLERLPKWAQREFDLLKQTADSWRNTIDSMEEGKSNVRIWGGAREDDVYLPNDSIIEFVVGSKTSEKSDYTAESVIQVRIKEGYQSQRGPDGQRVKVTGVEIMATGASRMSIQPQSGNVVFVEVEQP